MRIKYIVLLIVIILSVGCSSKSAQPVKTQTGESNPLIIKSEVVERGLESYDPRHLSFPITESKRVLSNRNSLNIIDLGMMLSYYYKTFGEFPKSMKEWVLSG